LSVCLSVCHSSEPCKNGCTDRDALWVEDSGGPRNHVLDGAPHCPWEGAILRWEEAAHCKVYGHSAVVCVKTAEPVESRAGSVWIFKFRFDSISSTQFRFFFGFGIHTPLQCNSILVCENTKTESIKFDIKFQLKSDDRSCRM